MEEFREKLISELKYIYRQLGELDEISEFIFDEQNKKVHRNITIDCVNHDCLAEIFKYVPVCERPKIAWVCQKWRKALHLSWGNVKKLELAYFKCETIFADSTCLNKFLSLDEQLSFLKTLLYKCGRYLTQLDLTAYGHCNIVPVINEYCPNLVELRLRFTYVDNVILFDAFSRLSKLKVLAIIFQDFNDEIIPLNLIYSLRTLADTLTDLILSRWENEVNRRCIFPKETIDVIRELKALKRVDVGGIGLPQDLHSYLYDKMSQYAVHDIYFLKVVTNQFQNTKQLCLGELLITDDGLYAIANNMKQLTLLRLFWSNLTNVGMVTISKMKLRVLDFNGSSSIIDSSSINLLKNLKAVRFPCNNNITDDVAMKVLENSPKIALIYLLHTSVTVKFIKKAIEISKKRNVSLQVFENVLLFGSDKRNIIAKFKNN